MMTHSPQKIMRNLATASLVGLTLVLAACGGAAGATDTRVEAPLAPDVTAPTIQDDPEDQLESYTPDYLSFDQIILYKDNLSAEQRDAALSYLNAGDFDLTKPSHQKLALTLFEYLDITDESQRETAHSILRANREAGETRIIVQRDGNWVVAEAPLDLIPGDQIDITSGTEDRAFVRANGVPVFHGVNDGDIPFVFDAQNPSPEVTNAIIDIGVNHGFTMRGELEVSLGPILTHFFYGTSPEEIHDSPENGDWIFVFPVLTFDSRMNGGTGREVWAITGEASINNREPMFRLSSVTPSSTRGPIENALRRIARNNPNVVVIGFDGNRIRG